jgi:hypothetical protein
MNMLDSTKRMFSEIASCSQKEGCKIPRTFNKFPGFPKILVGGGNKQEVRNPPTRISGNTKEFIESSWNYETLLRRHSEIMLTKQIIPSYQGIRSISLEMVIQEKAIPQLAGLQFYY